MIALSENDKASMYAHSLLYSYIHAYRDNVMSAHKWMHPHGAHDTLLAAKPPSDPPGQPTSASKRATACSTKAQRVENI
ncbi:unnamed protein product [Ceratitis capitata]|uniref:(Mediterranean fruit fly) hypothetical protein n=1 Tax=Ceratitis capitata TaxID=7213 RepID=A0A811V0E5_CERCA|nr:unnamed protein product [Ceratitis capitata]